MAISAFIQAGGHSSRMRTDKAWLQFGDHCAIELVIKALHPIVDELAIVANSEEYGRLGLPVYADIVKNYGPLGGIYTALTHASNDKVLIVACDLPLVSTDLFRRLAAEDGEYQIIVPLNKQGQTEQMCAIYSKT